MACSKPFQPRALPRRRASLGLISPAHFGRRRRGEQASNAADNNEGYEARNVSVALQHPIAHAERNES